MAMILCVTTTTEDGKGRGLSFDSTLSPDQVEALDDEGKKSLARLLIGTARNVLGESNRHTIPAGVLMMAEHTVMSSDLEFDTTDQLDDFMCAVAFGIKAERERGNEAARYAENLAVALHGHHYQENKQWKPLTGDLAGLLTQIDNMTVGLVRKVEA